MSAFIPPVATITSTTALQARKRVLSLYREWIRQAPEIVDIYRLEFSSKVVRQRIRQEFEKNRYVSDLHTIDILVFKGRTEFEETMNVMRWFNDDKDMYAPPRKQDFMSKFIDGSCR